MIPQVTGGALERVAPSENSMDFALLRERSRAAQRGWSATAFVHREKCFRKLSGLLADSAEALTDEVARLRGVDTAEALVSEIVPLLDSVKYLGRQTSRVLRARSPGRAGRPVWLAGVHHRIERQPHGLVLVIAPGNYPLFLGATQALQAVAAGNVVWCKPAPGADALFAEFQRLFVQAGFPPEVLQVLPSSEAAARAALRGGIDFVVFTGSSNTGRKILESLADRGVPSIMELSGVDAAIVLDDADLALTARALAFGITLNRGATCIAPRRVFVARSVLAEFTRLLREELVRRPEIILKSPETDPWLGRVKEALDSGAFVIAGSLAPDHVKAPLVLGGVPSGSWMLREDTFASVMTVTAVASEEEALNLNETCSYGLGASVFSRDESRARRVASRLRAGLVCVNDVIAPSADPRVPFGGTGDSGFGVTRGEEGLLAMTAPRVVSVNGSGIRRHYQPVSARDERLIHGWVRFAYGHGWWRKWKALVQLFKGGPTPPKPDSQDQA